MAVLLDMIFSSSTLILSAARSSSVCFSAYFPLVPVREVLLGAGLTVIVVAPVLVDRLVSFPPAIPAEGEPLPFFCLSH